MQNGRLEGLIPPSRRLLCRLDDLPRGASKGFPPPEGGFYGLFAVRDEAGVHVYRNSCPHLGVPLEWVADRFLSSDGSRIVCAMHGAQLRICDGLCLEGPCRGERLEPVACHVEAGMVYVAQAADP